MLSEKAMGAECLLEAEGRSIACEVALLGAVMPSLASSVQKYCSRFFVGKVLQ